MCTNPTLQTPTTDCRNAGQRPKRERLMWFSRAGCVQAVTGRYCPCRSIVLRHESDERAAEWELPPKKSDETERFIFGSRLVLDGVRALAVIAVVLFHASAPAADGGFLGVDVFFALSGFLITSLLVEEHLTKGTMRLGAFYARRTRDTCCSPPATASFDCSARARSA